MMKLKKIHVVGIVVDHLLLKEMIPMEEMIQKWVSLVGGINVLKKVIREFTHEFRKHMIGFGKNYVTMEVVIWLLITLVVQ
jgi:hypothetical protein